MSAISLKIALSLSLGLVLAHAANSPRVSYDEEDLLGRTPSGSPSPEPSVCNAAHGQLGNGRCNSNGNSPFNTAACGWDGGDCCPDTCVNAQHTCGSGGGYDCKDPTSIYQRAHPKWQAIFENTPCQYALLTVFNGVFYYDGVSTCVGQNSREYGVCPFHHLHCAGGATYGTDAQTRDAILAAIANTDYKYPGFEAGCPRRELCGWKQYTCMNRRCVGLATMCDGTDDCEDGTPSDEDDEVNRRLCSAPPAEIEIPQPGINITSPCPESLLGDTLVADQDPHIQVSRVERLGHRRCAGVFDGAFDLGAGALGFGEGIVLSTGKAMRAAGPNANGNTGHDYGYTGDAFLSGLIGGAHTFDACVLEVDFSCPSGLGRVRIDYVFASDEYPEYVNTLYNDVFGFALNGANIALVPHSGGLPVSINNINCAANSPYCDLFVANAEGDGHPVNLEADGLTTVLTASSNLQPGTNTMRFAIADVTDGHYDSWVFLKAHTFQCDLPVPDTVDANCEGEYFVGGADLPQYWTDLADIYGVDKTNLGFNTQAEVWCYNGHDTCIKWDEWDTPCDDTAFACAGSYTQPMTSGCGPSQIKFIMEMIEMMDTRHHTCPVCEDDVALGQIKMCKDGQEFIFASDVLIASEYIRPATKETEIARYTDCDCVQSFTGIALKTNGYWWNAAINAGLDPALVSHRDGKWYYDGVYTCVAMSEVHTDACLSAALELVCAGGGGGGKTYGYSAEQMAAVNDTRAEFGTGFTHSSCPV